MTRPLSVLKSAQLYIQRGWMPIPVRFGAKSPMGKAWQNQRITIENVGKAFSSKPNIGILLGKPSGGLIDVDIDHPLAHAFKHLLPPTGMIHGRSGNPSSHYWYKADGIIPATTQFKDPTSGKMIIEIRSTGAQTVVPPSQYTIEGAESHLTWGKLEEPGSVSASELHASVGHIAAMTLLADKLRQQGSRHVTALALSGTLLRGGYSVSEAEDFIEAVCKAADDDELEDRIATVAYTAERLKTGEPATGATALADLMGDKVVKTIQQWLGLKRSTSPSGGGFEANHSMLWDTPLMFGEVETPDIPSSLLPGVYGQYAAALAASAETPEALSTMAVLGTIAAVCSKLFTVSPSMGWNEPVNLYILIGLPPANNKSLVLNSSTAPIDSWENKQRLAMDSAIKQARSKRKNEESTIQSLRARAAKATDPARQQEMFNQVNRLEAELTEIPYPPQIYLNDVTAETLATAICEQNGKIAIISDEGGVMETMSGLYSKGHSNYDVLLKGIDGGRVRLRRKDRDLDINPYLTMLLVVQPQIIRNMSDKKAFQGRGLLERFLYVLPKSRLGYRSLEQIPVPIKLTTAFQQAVIGLLDIKPIVEHGLEYPHKLILSDDANEVWQSFRHEIEIELRPEGKLNTCLGWGGKIVGFTLRIAGLLHVAEHGDSINTIDSMTMGRAVKMAWLLVEHALTAFGLMRDDESNDDAQAIVQWVIQTKTSPLRRTECLKKFHGRFTSKKRLDAALAVLADRNIISPLRHETTTEGKRASMFYDVNPQLFDQA